MKIKLGNMSSIAGIAITVGTALLGIAENVVNKKQRESFITKAVQKEVANLNFKDIFKQK